MISVQQKGDAVTFSVRVHPKARRQGISGIVGDALKVDIAAPALEGKANEACIRFFADFLKVPRSSITITAGINSRNKLIRITAVSRTRVEEAFTIALAQE